MEKFVALLLRMKTFAILFFPPKHQVCYVCSGNGDSTRISIHVHIFAPFSASVCMCVCSLIFDPFLSSVSNTHTHNNVRISRIDAGGTWIVQRLGFSQNYEIIIFVNEKESLNILLWIENKNYLLHLLSKILAYSLPPLIFSCNECQRFGICWYFIHTCMKKWLYLLI